MYTKILQNLEKIKKMVEDCSGFNFVYKGEPFTAIALASAHKPLATLYYINAVSVLDDALELYIKTNCPKEGIDTLGKRIKYLKSKSILSDPGKMTNLKNSRNRFAHRVGKYSSWNDVKNALKDIDDELRHLLIIS